MSKATQFVNCLATIEAIASSESVDQYLIGFTSKSAQAKGSDYRRIGFTHLVVLADRLDCDSALALESKLQEATMLSNDTSASAQKYHAEKKAKARTYRSHGGTRQDQKSGAFSVYMAWWER